MHWATHWGSGFLPLFPLFPLLFLGLIVWLSYRASRWFGWRNRQGFLSRPGEANALEILRRRYASGEIDASTFEQMRERLEGSARPRD